MTLEDLHQRFSDMLNENQPPADTDPLHPARTRWFNDGQKDIAKRWFFKDLLKMGTISIVGNTPSYAMPSDFTKPNGLYLFATDSGSIVFTNPVATKDNILAITRDFATGGYQITFSPVPTGSDTGRYWYFAEPPTMAEPTDPVLLSGDAILFFALRRHFFTNRQWVPMQEARDEYENQIDELLKMNEIPPPGALLNMRSIQSFSPHGTNHRQFYSGNSRRNLG